MKNTFFAIALFIFAALTGLFFWMKSAMPEFNFNVLMTGNVIMLLLSVGTFFMVSKQIHVSSHAFFRGVYSSTFLKLFICIIGIVGYAMINKPNVHKPSLFVLLGIYFVYTAVETVVLSQLAKEKK